MWRVVAVVLGVVVLAGGGVVAGSALAQAGGGVDIVYVATGENFPDALSAAAAAGAGNDPVLLVLKDAIPTVTRDELNRLQPGRIVIAGGTGVVSTGVENQLKGLPFGPIVTRFGGADRYETAALLSEVTFPATGATTCSPLGFFPPASDFGYASFQGRTLPLTEAAKSSLFCDLQLPHGATITKVSAGVRDFSGQWMSCSLQRIDVKGGIGGLGMGIDATIASTSQSIGSSGNELLSTTTITEPEVNTKRYAYFGQCFVGDFAKLQVYGLTVEYTLP